MEVMEKNVEEIEEIEATKEVETPTTEEMVEEGVELKNEETTEELEAEEVEDVEAEEEPQEEMLPKSKVSEIVESRLKRDRRSRMREEADEKEILDILGTALGVSDPKEIKKSLKEFYKGQGVEIPDRVNERDERVLAKADAEEIIEAGEEEMTYIANEIASKPYEKRTIREKVIFETVANKLIENRQKRELEKMGVGIEVLKDEKFLNFKSRYRQDIPISEVYEDYRKLKETPKKPIGSVKTTVSKNEVKEFYTPDEVDSLTDKDYENPKIMDAVRKSMLKW